MEYRPEKTNSHPLLGWLFYELREVALPVWIFAEEKPLIKGLHGAVVPKEGVEPSRDNPTRF